MISKVINGQIVPLTKSDMDEFCARSGAEDGSEKMSDYIERGAVLDLVDKGYLVSNDNYGKVRKLIEEVPSAGTRIVRSGSWEVDTLDGLPGYRPTVIVCSNCRMVNISRTPYCPWCGTEMKMEGVNNN